MDHSCGGNCGSCGGCGKELLLSQPELAMLRKLGQIPFWPVARASSDTTPIFLEDSDYTPEEYSLTLQLLEKKGLIDLDYSKPLSGFDMAQYQAFPVHGSMALTARGQQVLELLELHGIRED